MSSLANQLKKLQIPTAQSASSGKKQNLKASLLFDGKEASNIDNETIFSLAINGLEELKHIEPAFGSFRENLFSEVSKKLERSLQTQEFNNRLDKQIAQFLKYLSPYFLLKPAHKTLEWLIRRYRVHDLNQDALLFCALPYHETKLFARLVQLLNLKIQGTNWGWLQQLQKNGSPLSKTTLIQRCASELTFMSDICELVPSALATDCPTSSLRIVLTFYASTIVGALEMMERVSEEVIGKLLPYIIKGLKSGVSEYKCASYMVIAQLCNKCNLEDNLVKSLLDSICKYLSVDVIQEGLMCVTIVCSTHPRKRLPKKALRHLLHIDGIVNHICKLTTMCDVTALLQVLLPQLVTAVVKDCLPSTDSSRKEQLVDVLYAMAKELEMDKSMVESVARTLIDEYCSARSALGNDDANLVALHETLKSVTQYIEKRYPKELEAALESSMESLKSTVDDEGMIEQYSTWILEFVSLAISGFKSKVLPEASGTLMLSLYHPKGEVRQMAVKHLHNLITSEQVSHDDTEFIREALLGRLGDDDAIVVDSVLSMKEALIKYLPSEALVNKLLSLLDSANWNEQCDKALEMLMDTALFEQSEALQNRIAFGLISLLLLNTKNHKQTVLLSKTMAQSPVLQKHFLLKDMKTLIKTKEWKACEKTNGAGILACGNRALISWLADNLGRLTANELLKKTKQLSAYSKLHPESLFVLILNCVLGKLVTKTTVAKDWYMMDIILDIIFDSLRDVEKQDGTFSPPKEGLTRGDSGLIPEELMSLFITHWSKGRIRRTKMAKGAIHLWLLGNVITSLPVNKTVIQGDWWEVGSKDSDEFKYTKVLLSVFNVIIHGTARGKSTVHYNMYRQLLQLFIQTHLSSTEDLIKFLSLTWCSHPSLKDIGSPVILQHHSLQIANTCIAVMDRGDVKTLSSDSLSVLSLLVPLTSPIAAIRQEALSCLKSLKTNTTAPPPVGTLVSLLVDSGEEITADHEHLQRILTTAFSHVSSKPTKSKKAAEEKLLEGLLGYLVRHTVSKDTPIHVQKCLWMVMSGVVTQSFLIASLPWMDAMISKAQTTGLSSNENTCLQFAIKKFCPATVNLLESDLKCHGIIKRMFSLTSPFGGGIPPVTYFMEQITEEFFQAIPSRTVQQIIVSHLLETVVEANSMALVNKAKYTLVQIPLAADLVVEELCELTSETKTPRKKKTKRTTPDDKQHEDSSWQRATVILEMIQQKDNILGEHDLIPALFGLLSRCSEGDGSEQVNFDYIKQLLLTKIMNICQRVDTVFKGGLSEDKFNVELIVQCIRDSENPQTHHHALLLLAEAARLFPEKVLHNVMSIFTFMGANILRQDDSYSFQVINKTVETVIPALIQAGEKQQLSKLNVKGSPAISIDDIVAMVIRVFVDASPHIPEHRRLSVFSHLVSTVGSAKFLHITMTLLIERFVVHSTDTDSEEGTVKAPLDEEFCLALCQEFDPSDQAEAMLNLLKYVAQMPAEKPDVPHRQRATRRSTAVFSSSSPLFDVQAHSSKHLRQFKFVAVGFISAVLGSDAFVNQVKEQSNQQKTMEKIYLQLIEELLTLTSVTAQHVEEHSQGTTGKFWRALLHKIYDIIDKVNDLLPTSVFLNVICRLLQNSNSIVKRKSMELLNVKLGHTKTLNNQIDEVVQLVTVLLSLVRTMDGGESPINRQSALYSLKLLTRILAEKRPPIFTEIVKVCIQVITAKTENSQVLSNGILCLGEVCTALKANAIPFLPKFMPSLLSLLDKTGQDRNVVILLCTVVTLHKVLETLPNFLSPYLAQILNKIIGPDLNNIDDKQDISDKDSNVQQLYHRLSVFRKSVAHTVTPRVLIPAVSQCYDDIIDDSHMSVPLLMEVVNESVACMTKHDVTTYSDQIFKFMFSVLDFRVTQPQCEPDLQDQIESSVIDSFCELVMKMSEATFRPVFLKLFERATRKSKDKDRLVVFYRLCDRIADKLKGLMALFAGYIIKNCASLLDSNNILNQKEPFYVVTNSNGEKTADTKKCCLLVQYILDCLQKCLCYATQGFMNKDRFTCLMQPVVDQLENLIGSTEEFQEMISNHVVPCLAQLAVAAGNDNDWKTLNYQVLLKTRHTSSQVRFAALKALEELYRQLGEEFIVILLPESIPFLAELMEDECVEVEKQCQHVVQQIETIIGEPIQKYFET